MRSSPFALLVVLALSTPAAANAAQSAETKECIAAFDQGQHSKSDHHLKQSQQQLLACTKETCPAVLRADCAEVLRSVQTALPSIVLAADDNGRDVTDVKVMNGIDPVASSLDGKAIELDPGTYDFRFERGTNPPLTVHFVLREGEKNRTVKASFNPPKPVIGPQMVTPPRAAVGYAVPGAFVALGVAGFVVAGISRLAFNNGVKDLAATCSPNCTQIERDDLSAKLVRANVAFGIGIGGLVLAVASWIVFTPTPKQLAPTSAALTW